MSNQIIADLQAQFGSENFNFINIGIGRNIIDFIFNFICRLTGNCSEILNQCDHLTDKFLHKCSLFFAGLERQPG